MSSITWHQPERYWVVTLDDQILGVYDAPNRAHAIHFCTEDADLLGDGNMVIRDAILSGDMFACKDGLPGQLNAAEFKVEVQSAIHRDDRDRINALLDAALHYAPARFGSSATMPPALYRDFRLLEEHLQIVHRLPNCWHCPLCRIAELRRKEATTR